ncbi:odorant receptor 85c-like [Maniola hyperantus]|uniref:odorant receptor 85c-like n=1 Tax=Aphantopus hyperantus TaxID=2795564 RepID=UPI0037480C0D
MLKRDQVKQIDSYQRVYCFLLAVYLHCYFDIPLLIILIKKVLKRDVLYLTPVKFTLPFDYQNNIVLFVVFYLFDFSMIWTMTYAVLGSLFFISVSMNQLSTLFVLLQEDFKEIIKAKDADIDVKLKQTIQKHSTLLDMLAQLGDAYGVIFAIRVFFLCITICFYGIAAKINSRLTGLENLMASVVLIVNIYHCCKHGQLATDSALDVATAVYNSPWEDLSCSNRKIILLIILRSQRATYIRSTSFTEISLKTFKMIMNTTYSFISLLTTMYET